MRLKDPDRNDPITRNIRKYFPRIKVLIIILIVFFYSALMIGAGAFLYRVRRGNASKYGSSEFESIDLTNYGNARYLASGPADRVAVGLENGKVLTWNWKRQVPDTMETFDVFDELGAAFEQGADFLGGEEWVEPASHLV